MNSDEIIARFSIAMDEAMAAYHANKDIIFKNGALANKFRYDPKYMKSLSWDNYNTCIYKGCNEKAIQASHTIQKSTSLLSISENKHVLSPSFDYRIENFILSPVGVNSASTFPGFCSRHEQIFRKFEDKKEFINEQDFRLQIYRTICREIIENKRSLASALYRNDQYIRFRDDTLNELIKKEIVNQQIDLKNLKSLSHKYNDNKVRYFANYIKSSEAYLKTLDKLHDAVFNDISKGKVQKIFFEAINIDWVIPCCLAGRGGIVIKTKSKTLMVDLILNVLPYENKTYLILATHHKHKTHLKKYVNRYKHHPLAMVTMVESWMLYGSDHWFLKPAVWNNLDKEVQKELIHEIFSEKNINAIPPHFIFNDLRLELKKLLEI